MERQDLTYTRSAVDLERKLKNIVKNYEVQKLGLNKVENENKNILSAIIINLDGILESQSDIFLWFFSGVPTLENNPYTEWSNYDEHIGDIYYDKDTGKVYIFENINDEFIWKQSDSPELMKAMALSNAQVKDDFERKVFFNTPYTPYQNGDWYVDKNGNLYICQVSRNSDEGYRESDFIIATKYVDDTKAFGNGDNLKIISGTVVEIIKDIDELSNKITNTTELLDGQDEKIGILEQKSTEISQTVDNVKIEIVNQIKQEGVTTLKNTTITIDNDGLKSAKNDSDIASLLNNIGVFVSDGKIKEDNSNLLMKVDRDGGYLKTLEVKNTIKEQEILQKEVVEDEDFGICQAWYWIGSETING